MLKKAGYSKKVKLTEVIIATLLIVCFVICLIGVIYAEQIGFYTSRPDNYNETVLSTQFIESNNFNHIVDYATDLNNGQDVKEHLENFAYNKTNIRFIVTDKATGKTMLTNIRPDEVDSYAKSASKRYKMVDVSITGTSGTYFSRIKIYAADELLARDDISKGYTLYKILSHFSEAALVMGVLFAVASVVCVYGLLCSAGHRYTEDSDVLNDNFGKEEKNPDLEKKKNIRGVIKFVSPTEVIERNMFDCIPLDLLCVMYVGVVSGAAYLMDAFPSPSTSVFFAMVVYSLLAVFGIIVPTLALMMSIATRSKLGGMLENTVIYRVFIRPFVLVFSELSEVWKSALSFSAYALGSLLLLIAFFEIRDVAFVRYLSMFLLFVIQLSALYRVCVRAQRFSRLHRKAKEIADGNFGEQIDASEMEGEYREHALLLNNIDESVSKAVEEGMKSERLRTELITNVSHDIKTPLTSIVNYVDILKKELKFYDALRRRLNRIISHGTYNDEKIPAETMAAMEAKPVQDPDDNALSEMTMAMELSRKRISDYMAILAKHSAKLKKLIEDLVEASKAATGNITVSLTKVNLLELVEQTMGEYEEKLAASELTVPVRIPERLNVTADGRLLWRVLDNLFSNACKYAQPGTRLYVDAMEKDGRVTVSVKNISRDILSNSSDELMERFIRGDGSRTTEGSGLGLSIARNLVLLQGGTFSVDIDGDLFKVTIVLPEWKEETQVKQSL